MYRFLQKHGKKVMAVAGVGLMIAFIVPSAAQYGGQGDAVVGRMGEEKIRSSELFNARQSWDLLTRVSINESAGPIARALGPHAFSQIMQHPDLFLLLQKEAQQMGVTVTKDQLETIVTNAPGLLTTDLDRNEQIRRALHDLLLVRQAFVRAASAIKISEPMVQHELAQANQSIMLDLVEFSVAQYSDKVPAPTAEQFKAQFEKYADVPPGPGGPGNPFGFGYQYPDRVKLQYIVVPRADVRKVVEASRTPYQWEVDGRIYYKQNQALFASTQSAAGNESFSLDSTSRPTTRPFEEVRDEVKDRLIEQATDARMTAIRDRLTSMLAADWVAYRNAAGTATQPTTVPASSVGAPYNSVEYLQKVAERIQANKDLGVLATVVSLADKWLTAEDLAQVPGMGQATLNGTPVARYIMALTAPFLPAEHLNETGVIRVMEPTRPATDSNQSIYIARVSAAEPAHKPQTLAEVEPMVRADVIKQQAYEMAKADAEKLLEQARARGLGDAAGGKGVVTAGPIAQPAAVIPGFNVTGLSAEQFTEQAFRLVSTPASRPSGKPAALIELAKDGRVVVAELGEVQAMWNDQSRPLMEARVHTMMATELMQRFSQDWFNYQSVVARLNYIADPQFQDRDPAPTPRPVPPIF